MSDTAKQLLRKYKGISTAKSDKPTRSEPIPLEAAPETEVFPVDIFPEPIQQIIRETNECLNFPLDYIGASILFATSVAVGNSYKVKFKEGWTQSSVLYLVLVGRPGVSKSHPLGFAIEPIKQAQIKNHLEYKKALADYQQDPDLFDKPVFKRYYTVDSTLEKLYEMHDENPRGIGVYYDEIAGLLKNFNRYNSGSDQEFYLSAWSGKSSSKDTKSGGTIMIYHPHIPIAGTIQPKVLGEMAANKRDGNGFIDRFLFAMPDGQKKDPWSKKDIHPQCIADYNLIIERLLEIPYNCVEPYLIEFDAKAKELLFKWQEGNTDRCNAAESESLAGVYSKFDDHIMRFCLILQMLKYGCAVSHRDSIELDTVRKAIKLATYFRKMAEKVHAILGDQGAVYKFSTLQRNVYENLPVNFNTSEGVTVAKGEGMPERTFKRWLKDRELFEKVGHGQYERLF